MITRLLGSDADKTQTVKRHSAAGQDCMCELEKIMHVIWHCCQKYSPDWDFVIVFSDKAYGLTVNAKA